MRQDEIEHLLEDPVKNHKRIMQMLQPTQPAVVYKDYTGEQPSRVLDDTNGNGNGNGEQPLFSEEQIDVIAQAMADLRSELQSMVAEALGPLTEQVATLQGQVSVLMNLIGSLVGNGNGNKNIEASETKTKTVRRVRQIESKHDRQ